MKPTWLTTEPCDPPVPGTPPRFRCTKTPGNMTYSLVPILNHLPPMPTNILLLASTSFEARCQCPMVAPTSLNGNGCAPALPTHRAEVNKSRAIKLYVHA